MGFRFIREGPNPIHSVFHSSRSRQAGNVPIGSWRPAWMQGKHKGPRVSAWSLAFLKPRGFRGSVVTAAMPTCPHAARLAHEGQGFEGLP